jgi:hypothetical protein
VAADPEGGEKREDECHGQGEAALALGFGYVEQVAVEDGGGGVDLVLVEAAGLGAFVDRGPFSGLDGGMVWHGALL